MKLSRLLSIVKLGIDVLLSEHLQLRCIDSSMYRYTPIYLNAIYGQKMKEMDFSTLATQWSIFPDRHS